MADKTTTTPTVLATPGAETSEYAVAQSVKVWSIVIAILGLVDSVGSSIAAGFGADTKASIIVGAVIAVAGVISKTLVSLGYSKARADVKVAIATPLTPPELQ
jgi:hypothetical protein